MRIIVVWVLVLALLAFLFAADAAEGAGCGPPESLAAQLDRYEYRRIEYTEAEQQRWLAAFNAARPSTDLAYPRGTVFVHLPSDSAVVVLCNEAGLYVGFAQAVGMARQLHAAVVGRGL